MHPWHQILCKGGSQETGAECEVHGMQGEIKLFVDADEEFPHNTHKPLSRPIMTTMHATKKNNCYKSSLKTNKKFGDPVLISPRNCPPCPKGRGGQNKRTGTKRDSTPPFLLFLPSSSPSYILVQLTAHVSLSGLPVLRTLYKLTPMHKRTNSQNCEFCVL